MKKLLLIALPLLAVLAWPSSTSARFVDWVGPTVMENCDNVAINSTVTCGPIIVWHRNFVTFEFNYTQSNGTDVQFYLEACNEGRSSTDCTDAADWFIVGLDKVVGGTALEVYPDPVVLKFNGSSGRLSWSTGTNYAQLRLRDVQSTGSPDANDVITVTSFSNWNHL